MKKNFLIDYLSYISFKLIGPIIRFLPKRINIYLGKALGLLLYYFDIKHRAIAYANIKRALGSDLSLREISRVTKRFYLNFGQNLLEIFLIPTINRQYFKRYIQVEGAQYITEAFKRNKGVILLGVHAGSWELSNVVCANLGFPFNLLVRDQKMLRLNQLLNTYRQEKGCKLVSRHQTRTLIEALKDNQAIGMTVDQGGKNGEVVNFFGKSASLATGALRLALKYTATILPTFFTRIKGLYQKIIIEAPFEIKKTQDHNLDIRSNLERLAKVYEKYIRKYPQEYLWTYKIWKHSKERNILLLSDAKIGHLRQTQAVARIIQKHFKEKGINTFIDTVEVKIKNKFALTLSSIFSGRYTCQGCLWCLRRFLNEDTYNYLVKMNPDIVISCGSSLAPINFIIARQSLAKSIVIMRPSILSSRRFDLVIMPKHDKFPKRKNVLVTEGALNLIDDEYLKEQTRQLIQESQITPDNVRLYLGLLIGGDTKEFVLKKDDIQKVIRQIKLLAKNLNADLLVTTSRRTSLEIENLVKEEFKNYSGCKLLIIANEKNLASAVGGILGLSSIIITTPESISMISEAVNSQKYVVVFRTQGLSRKHQGFINNLAKNKYIFLTEIDELSKTIEDVWQKKPPVNILRDNFLIKEAIGKIL
jgi:KDO2-lipid IV(A) lauroyltransferase